MKYTFKKALFFPEATIELGSHSLKLLNRSGNLRREIAFSEIKEIRESCDSAAQDSKGNRFKIAQCTVVGPFRRLIGFQSYSFVSAGKPFIAKNQAGDFNRLVLTIKQRAVQCNPDVEAVVGNQAASFCGIGLMMAGLLMQGLFIFGSLSNSEGTAGTMVGILIGTALALPLLFLGRLFHRVYRPVRYPVKQSMHKAAVS